MLPPRNERFSFTKVMDDSSKHSENSILKDDLNCSVDSGSTASTSMESTSKGSECSLENYEIETPPNFRCRQAFNFEGVQPITWLVDNPLYHQPNGRRSKGRGKPFNFPRWSYYTYGFIATLLLLTLKVMTTSPSGDAIQYNSWSYFLNKQAAPLLQQIRQDHLGESFTVVLKGSRLDFLQQAVDAYSMCSSVKEVQIDFVSKDVPATILALGDKVSTVRAIETSGTFLVSEDVILSCRELEKGKIFF